MSADRRTGRGPSTTPGGENIRAAGDAILAERVRSARTGPATPADRKENLAAAKVRAEILKKNMAARKRLREAMPGFFARHGDSVSEPDTSSELE